MGHSHFDGPGGNAIDEKRMDLVYNAASAYTSIVRFDDVGGGGTNTVAESDFLYDGLGRIVDLSHSLRETIIDAFGWEYDPLGRVTAFTSSVDGTADFTYDHTSQLIAADYSFQADEECEYDENGNRTMDGYVIDPNNQLLSDGVFNYEYDGEGNTTRKVRISEDPATDYETLYAWDHRNRLMTVVQKDDEGTVTMAALYVYDTFDRRIVKTVDFDGAGLTFGEKTLRYFREPMPHSGGPGDSTHVAAVLNEEDEVVYRFLHGDVVDQVFAVESAIDGTLWTLTDNQGTVRDIVDQSGAVQNHITYSAFGSITDETDPTDNLVYYAGRDFDRETGDYHNRARQYAPDIGQFRSQDPIGFKGKDTNVQRYVGNHPTISTDPSGLAEPGFPPASMDATDRQSPAARARNWSKIADNVDTWYDLELLDAWNNGALPSVVVLTSQSPITKALIKSSAIGGARRTLVARMLQSLMDHPGGTMCASSFSDSGGLEAAQESIDQMFGSKGFGQLLSLVKIAAATDGSGYKEFLGGFNYRASLIVSNVKADGTVTGVIYWEAWDPKSKKSPKLRDTEGRANRAVEPRPFHSRNNLSIYLRWAEPFELTGPAGTCSSGGLLDPRTTLRFGDSRKTPFSQLPLPDAALWVNGPQSTSETWRPPADFRNGDPIPE